MFFQYIKKLFLLLSLLSMYVFALNSEDVRASTAPPPNKFNEINIEIIKQTRSLSCHQLTTSDIHWKKITFNQIPQNKHFCIRAWINIDKSLMKSRSSLLIGMLGASSFYWDEKLISQNGEVGTSINNEVPGIITTLVNIPEHYLTDGKHLLSGEISTFHLSKKLSNIGYIFTLVDEQKLHSQILLLSIFAAIFIGASLVLAMIFQLIYWLYQKEVSYQIFSLFCLFSSLILITEQAKFWLDYSYDWHIFRLLLIYSFTFIACSLLPLFYLCNYRLPYKIHCFTFIVLGFISLSLSSLSYDQASTFLFGGALLSALIINTYSVFHTNKGLVNIIIILPSLSLLYFIPDYFNEFVFSVVFILIVMAMLISLIKEMYTNKVAALKAERIKTELLRRNMQPHFLMNCLTQLMELVEIKPKKAVEFISVLSDEFRQLTVQSTQDNIALTEEIALCNKHLAIMSIRYQQTYQLDVNGDVADIFIPPTILHSQIENCFTHNAISSTRAFELKVTSVNGQIDLVLKTPIEKKIDHRGTGLGEQYIKARLAEFEQVNNKHKNSLNCSFISYEECHYWVSKFSFIS